MDWYNEKKLKINRFESYYLQITGGSGLVFTIALALVPLVATLRENLLDKFNAQTLA